jgi:hypothetical protein
MAEMPVQTGGLAMPMNDDQRVIYMEAGQWVRLANTTTWAMAAIFPALAVAPLVLSLTTRVPKLPLVVFSVAMMIFWLRVDYIYERGANQARAMLMDIERTHALAPLDLYTQQSRLFPRAFTVLIMYLIFSAALALVWILTWNWAPYPPILAK